MLDSIALSRFEEATTRLPEICQALDIVLVSVLGGIDDSRFPGLEIVRLGRGATLSSRGAPCIRVGETSSCPLLSAASLEIEVPLTHAGESKIKSQHVGDGNPLDLAICRFGSTESRYPLNETPPNDRERTQLARTNVAPPEGISDAHNLAGTRIDPNVVLDADARERVRISQGLPDRYEVIAELSRGGMGTIFHVRDRHLSDAERGLVREFAVKVCHVDDLALQVRFLRELRALAAVNSPFVVPIVDAGFLTGTDRLYYVMPVLHGADLETRIDDRSRPGEDANRKVRIVEDLHAFADGILGLEALHRAGVVHRDVKPANVWRCEGGRGLVLDPGLARTIATGEIDESSETPAQASKCHTAPDSVDEDVNFETVSVAFSGHALKLASLERRHFKTGYGSMIGTPIYMSPEAFADAEVDARSDLYSAGASLYHLISGRPPFDGSFEEIMAGHRGDAPPPLDVDLELALLVQEAMEREPRNRISSAEEFADRLSIIVERLHRDPARLFVGQPLHALAG